MKLVLDEDVEIVAEFMMHEIDSLKLCFVADGLAQIAQLLWGRYADQHEHPQVMHIHRNVKGLYMRLCEPQQPLDVT